MLAALLSPRFSPVPLATLALLLWTTTLACGAGAGGGSLQGNAGRLIEGQYAWRPVPTNEQLTAFGDFGLEFVAYEALAGGNDLATMGPEQALSTAGLGCAATGCTYQQPNVDLSTATKGAFARITLTAAASQQAFVPTATMVISPNQIFDNKATRVGLTAQGEAVVLSQAGLAQLARLAGTTSPELLRRGICIGTVTTSRVFGAGTPPGQAGAYVSLVDAPAGASVFYVDDTWQAVGALGTNSAGIFVVIGPIDPEPGGGATTVPVTVSAGGASLHWPGQAIVTRPQMVVAMPILPYP